MITSNATPSQLTLASNNNSSSSHQNQEIGLVGLENQKSSELLLTMVNSNSNTITTPTYTTNKLNSLVPPLWSSEEVTSSNSNKRAAINLKCPAFSKLVSNSSSLDEGVESDMSSPISSTFSFASNTSTNPLHLAAMANKHATSHHHHSHHYQTSRLLQHNTSSPLASSSISQASGGCGGMSQGNYNQHAITADTSLSSVSSCLTSFESHCCPSPASMFMKSSVDETSLSSATNMSASSNNAFIQYSTSCAAACPIGASPSTLGPGKKDSKS